MSIENTAGVVVDPGARSNASLRLANGNIVDFVDALDGHVGVGEKANAGNTIAVAYTKTPGLSIGF